MQASQPELVVKVVGIAIVHVGPAGSGQMLKAANQLIVATNIQALSAATIFLEACGVDLPAAIEVLGDHARHIPRRSHLDDFA